MNLPQFSKWIRLSTNSVYRHLRGEWADIPHKKRRNKKGTVIQNIFDKKEVYKYFEDKYKEIFKN